MTTKVNIKQVTKSTVIGETFIDGRKNSNAGAISLGDFLVVIDPSATAESAPIFRKALEEHFKIPAKYLFVTHYHNDHTKGIHAFQDTIVIGSEELFRKMNAENKPYLPEITLTDKLTIENGGSQVEFHYFAGHTNCSAIAFFPEERIIFLGDLLFANEFPWAGDSSCNPDIWITFFGDILQYNFDFVIPGHGPLCDKAEIEKQLLLLKELRENTLEAIAENTGPSRIKKSIIYKNVNPSRETRTLRHFYDFYSYKKRS